MRQDTASLCGVALVTPARALRRGSWLLPVAAKSYQPLTGLRTQGKRKTVIPIYIYVYILYTTYAKPELGNPQDGWMVSDIHFFLSAFLTFGDVQLKDFVLLSWCDIVMFGSYRA